MKKKVVIVALVSSVFLLGYFYYLHYNFINNYINYRKCYWRADRIHSDNHRQIQKNVENYSLEEKNDHFDQNSYKYGDELLKCYELYNGVEVIKVDKFIIKFLGLPD